LLGVLRHASPEVDGIRLTRLPDDLDEIIARGGARPLVLAVRDAHRLPWQRELLARVLARRPDAIVVGTGTVHDRPLAGASYLGTRGAGRANLEAAAAVLLGPAAPAASAGPAAPAAPAASAASAGEPG
jgi:hypothetical protein